LTPVGELQFDYLASVLAAQQFGSKMKLWHNFGSYFNRYKVEKKIGNCQKGCDEAASLVGMCLAQ